MLTEQDLRHRIGVILRDGTPLRELIDLEYREVSLRVLQDPEIYELELKRLFANGWNVVAHDSEIPNGGDFVVRSIGEDGVIVTRDLEGDINVLLNACPHRAMQICRVDRGSETTLTCPYHGWAFDSKGNLKGAPFEKEMYGDWGGRKDRYGLIAARVEVLHGIVFATFGSPLTLDEYLGDFKFYIDWNFGAGEFEVTGPVTKFRMPANWKVLSDQLAGDGYHTAYLHRSLGEIGVQRPGLVGLPGSESEFGFHTNVGMDNGHALLSWDNRFIFAGRQPEADDPFGVDRSFPMQVFPSSMVSGMGRTEDGLNRGAGIGGLLPRGPGAFEMWQLPLMNKDLSPEEKAIGKSMAGLGNVYGSLIFADDAQQGPSTTRAAQGVVARERLTMKYNATHGTPNPPANWKGPGFVGDGFPKDDGQWHFWCHWFDVMTAE